MEDNKKSQPTSNVYIFAKHDTHAVLTPTQVKILAKIIEKDEENDYIVTSWKDENDTIHYEHVEKSRLKSINYIIDQRLGDENTIVRSHQFKNEPELGEPVYMPYILDSSSNYKEVVSKYASKDTVFYEPNKTFIIKPE